MSPSATSQALQYAEPLEFDSVPGASALSALDRQSDLKAGLQEKINRMQSNRLGSTRLPTVPALARILPGGGIHAGAAYSVQDSTTLAMALLAGPSSTGAWCSVVGIPSFSIEAAAGFGIELERLVLIPHAGDQWLTVTAAMIDVVSVVLTKAPEHITPSGIARLKARLRQRGAALIALGSWPQSDSVLSVSGSSWDGLGSGTGHLNTRRMTITASGHGGRSRSTELRLADLQHGPWQPEHADRLKNVGQAERTGHTGQAAAMEIPGPGSDRNQLDSDQQYFLPQLVNI